MAGRRLPAGGGDEAGESLGGGAAHARQQVLIGVHRERWVGVTEALGHDLDRGAVSDEQRRVRVAQVVEPNPSSVSSTPPRSGFCALRAGSTTSGSPATNPTKRFSRIILT
jgi:hypothetical protein